MSAPVARSVPARAAALTVLIFAWVGPTGAAAQAPLTVPPPPPAARSVTDVADALFQAGRHDEALEVLEEHLRTHDADGVAEKLAAREALVLAIAESASDPDRAKELFRRAIGHGIRATTLDPLDPESRYFTLAAEGRLALLGAPRERARAAVAVDKDARALLAMDSLHAGAHNALGRLYFEIARLSWVERLFARPLLGGDLLSRATWKAGEAHLRRAVELEPRRNLYYVDLGALLVERKRFDEARPVLDSALRVPLEFAGEGVFRDDAKHLLEEIARRTGSPAQPPAGP